MLFRSEEDYFRILLDTLIDCISGNSIRDVYFFSGNTNSFIELNSPLTFALPGLFWTGYIRMEGNAINKKQCIFCFIKIENNESRKIELYIENKKFIYALYKQINDVKELDEKIIIENIEVMGDLWHHITMLHFGNSFHINIDRFSWSRELNSQIFTKVYPISTIGASLTMDIWEPCFQFVGEMSTLYFFIPTSRSKELIKELATKDQQFLSLYAIESFLKTHAGSNEQTQIMNPVNNFKKLNINTQFVLDPKVIYLLK